MQEERGGRMGEGGGGGGLTSDVYIVDGTTKSASMIAAEGVL